MLNENISNIEYLEEKDYNIVPPEVLTWDGDIPESFFSCFPDKHTQKRASVYLTNQKLYNNDYSGTFDRFFQWTDYLRDLLTNMPINNTIAKLPDFKSIVDIWLSLFSSMPNITSKDTELTKKITTLLNNNNYQLKQNEIIKNTFFTFGNNVELILEDGSYTYPVKCWIPFVNKNLPSQIEVNCLYNIGLYEGKKICELSLYFKDGTVEKRTYYYTGTALSKEEVKSREVTKLEISPVVVFKGNSKDSSPFGVDSFRFWESAISSCIQTYQTILKLNTRLEEIIRLIPDGATLLDPRNGLRVYMNTGALAYDPKQEVPTVAYYTPDVDLNSAKEAYKQALLRLSRDTFLPYALFDSAELGKNTSAKALRTSMFLSSCMAKKMANEIKPQLKQFIYLLTLNEGISCNKDDFDIVLDTAFIKDDDEIYNIVSQRIGNKETMTQAQAISILDGVNMEIAEEQVKLLNGIVKNEEKEELTEQAPIIIDTLELNAKNEEKKEEVQELRESPLGGVNIGK